MRKEIMIMKDLNIKINELIDKRDELEKEYIEYLEADMNKEAKRINNKMHKIDFEIKELRDEQEYGLKQDMKRKIDLYNRFIHKNGLTYEFEHFIEEEEL